MKRHAYHQYLRQIPLFEGLDNGDLDVVGSAVTALTFPAGAVLMQEGTPSHDMMIVLDGTLAVTAGDEQIATIGPGGFAGEMGLLAHTTRHATVRALTDVSVLHLDGRSFSSVLNAAPQIAVKMLPVVAARVVENNARHSD